MFTGIKPRRMSNFKRHFLTTLTCFLFSFFSFAGDTDSLFFPARPDKNYFKSYITSTRDVFTAPGNWNKKQWMVAGSALVYTGSAFLSDDYTREFSQTHRSFARDNFTKWGVEPLSGLYSMPALGLLYCYGELKKEPLHQMAALSGVKAYVISAGVVNIPKYIFQRHRPFDSDNSFLFEGPFGSFKNTSFVSGHTTVAFAMAAALSGYYRPRPVVRVVLYSLAGAVALSRIYDNKHWGSDVVGGAFLGFAIGKMISNKDRKRYKIAF